MHSTYSRNSGGATHILCDRDYLLRHFADSCCDLFLADLHLLDFIDQLVSELDLRLHKLVDCGHAVV